MIITRYQIGQNNEMVVTKDNKGKIVSVTDKANNPAESCDEKMVRITNEDAKFRSTTMNVSEGTFIYTKHNPTCGWISWNRRWYYV